MCPECAQAHSDNSTRTQFIERFAFEQGCRISPCGTIATTGDGKRKTLWPDKNGYLHFTIYGPSGRRPIAAHRLQAFQKYGEGIYEEGLEVRHLDADQGNPSEANIVLGTKSQNAMDKPEATRVRVAGLAALKHDHAAVRAHYAASRSYKKTMLAFGLTSKGTLHHILNGQKQKEAA